VGGGRADRGVEGHVGHLLRDAAADVAAALGLAARRRPLALGPPGLAFPRQVELAHGKRTQLENRVRLRLLRLRGIGQPRLGRAPSLAGLAGLCALRGCGLAGRRPRPLAGLLHLDLGQLLRRAVGKLLGLELAIPLRLAAAVGERQLQRLDHVVQLHRRGPAQRRQGSGRAGHYQVGSMPRDRFVEAHAGDQGADRGRHDNLRQAPAGGFHRIPQAGLLAGELLAQSRRALGEPLLALHDPEPVVDVLQRLYVDAEPEAIEQLRPQLAFLRVHGADQDEVGGVDDGDGLPLHDVDPHRRRIQEHVHQVVVEQVDLVDVEQVAVGLGQHTGLEAPGARAHGRLHVDRSHHAVLGGVDRQLDHAHGQAIDRQAALPAPEPAVGAPARGLRGVAAVEAALNRVVVGQQAGQRPDRGRFGGPPVAPDQDAPDRRIDRVQEERQLHPLLPHDRAEGEPRLERRHAPRVYPRDPKLSPDLPSALWQAGGAPDQICAPPTTYRVTWLGARSLLRQAPDPTDQRRALPRALRSDLRLPGAGDGPPFLAPAPRNKPPYTDPIERRWLGRLWTSEGHQWIEN